MPSSSRDRLVRELQEKIQLLQGRQRSVEEAVFSTGLDELDRLFPQGGLAAGSLIEWLGKEEGCGAATLALFLAGHVQEQGGAVVALDDRREFYPPAAWALGVALQQTMVVRSARPSDALWSWEQVLRCRAVAAAVGWIDRLDDRAFRRLQLAAEAGGSIGFLLRPARCRSQPSWAQARFLVETLPSDAPPSSLARRLRIVLLYGRGMSAGQSVDLELNDETGIVHLVP